VLIPILYLKGISTGDFEEALAAFMGKDIGGLSTSPNARLKDAWVGGLVMGRELAVTGCRDHASDNVLNRLLDSLQGRAKRGVETIWIAVTMKDTEATFGTFTESSRNKGIDVVKSQARAVVPHQDSTAALGLSKSKNRHFANDDWTTGYNRTPGAGSSRLTVRA
jgi:hypothetical protein